MAEPADADPFDDTDVFLTSLLGMPDSSSSGDPKNGDMSRSSSELSLATTAIASPPPAMTIQAFCTFNGWFVKLQYPNEGNGWSYRADLGGQSVHRWEYGNSIVLMARHSTCGRAVIPRSLCRNCEMKQVWRVKCCEPCDTFFILPAGSTSLCVSALQPLIFSAKAATAQEYSMYTRCAPKASLTRKRGNDSEERINRMLRRETALRYQIGGGTEPNEDERPLLEQLEDALLTSIGGTNHQAEQLVLPSMTTGTLPTVGDSVGPISVNMLRAPSLSQLSCQRDTRSAYNILLTILSAQGASVKLATIAQIGSSHPLIKSTQPLREPNVCLDRLVQPFNITTTKPLMLILKSLLATWITTMSTTNASADHIVLHVGFYAPPSTNVYNDLCNNNVLPPFLLQAMHRVETYLSKLKTRPNVPPFMVVYFNPNGQMVHGTHMLPLCSIE